jgi:hypothetical protein
MKSFDPEREVFQQFVTDYRISKNSYKRCRALFVREDSFVINILILQLFTESKLTS